MSSIAYVTDNKIIEFHRLNGNNSINFWRCSNQKFSDFKVGDLLFFLTKERAKQKEKAVVGYGRCKDISKLGIKQTWDKYKQLNGFNTLKEFKAYLKKNIEEKVHYLSCIYLEDVVFFQNEIYLSDFNFYIDSQLAGYTYLDKNEDITSKILEKGIVDLWSVATGLTDESVIENSRVVHELNTIIDKIGSLKLNKISNRFVKSLYDDLSKDKRLREDSFEYYRFENDTLIITLPYVYNNKNRLEKLKELLGHISLIKYYLNMEKIDVKFRIVSSLETDEDINKILKEINK